eukprot:5668155-Alexandrium_andersonii.AAC.1
MDNVRGARREALERFVPSQPFARGAPKPFARGVPGMVCLMARPFATWPPCWLLASAPPTVPRTS